MASEPRLSLRGRTLRALGEVRRDPVRGSAPPSARFGEPRARRSAQPLRIGNPRQREVLGLAKCVLIAQSSKSSSVSSGGMPVFRQRAPEVLEHRAHAARDLQVVGAAGANLVAGDLDVVLPVRRAEDDARLPAVIENYFAAQLAAGRPCAVADAPGRARAPRSSDR